MLRVAILVKQVPMAESLQLGPDGRLERDQSPLEMNPYCRRAVTKGVELAQLTGGRSTVFTLGPPSAEDVLREAIAGGVDYGVHLCDPAFAGSDTLATSRALSAALQKCGPFDLVLVGRNSIDGDTGQVGPQLAQLCDLAFAAGVRSLDLRDRTLRLRLEHEDGDQELETDLPALLSVAERLCSPCKVDVPGREAVDSGLIRRLRASDLGPGPWGYDGSPTRVGSLRVMNHARLGRRLSGSPQEQTELAVRLLVERGALTNGATATGSPSAREVSGLSAPSTHPEKVVAVVLEGDRPKVNVEMLSAAGVIADELHGQVFAFQSGQARNLLPPSDSDDGGASTHTSADVLASFGIDELRIVEGVSAPEDLSRLLVDWAAISRPWAILSPSTDFGREIAARTAAALSAGLVGDAIALDIVDGELVAAKPAFSGGLIAEITCLSDIRMATVRPGVLPIKVNRTGNGRVGIDSVDPVRRVRPGLYEKNDDVEVLARAQVVIGVGAGLEPADYQRLSALAQLLGAEMAATRKVTDKGWAPRSRQIGVTGRSVAPRLYIAIAVSGKFNHMVGVRAAETVLAINSDPDAPIFQHADVGLVGEWQTIVPMLQDAIQNLSLSRDSSCNSGVPPP